MGDFRDGDRAFTGEGMHGMGSEATYAGALSFMRRKYTRDLTGVDVAVMGVPLDTATSNRPGARFGPAAVRAASVQLAWGKPWPWGFDPFESLAVIDHGDCTFDYGRPENSPAAITAQARAILRGLADVNFVGMDVVEVAPAYDIGQITALAAAHLALDYLCLRAERKRKG